jgi:hypothetical protein
LAEILVFYYFKPMSFSSNGTSSLCSKVEGEVVASILIIVEQECVFESYQILVNLLRWIIWDYVQMWDIILCLQQVS